jgi:uncharacterized protein involved in cysteine biosynthesis
LFDIEILKYTFLPLILSLVFWGIIFFAFGDDLIEFIASFSSHLPFGEQISIFIHSTGWIALSVVYYILSISTLGVFSSFFVDKIVSRINKKHYNCPVREVSFKDTLEGVKVSIKAFLVYIILFIFTFWLLFVPVVNVFYHLFMLTILNKAPLEFDSTYMFDIKEKKNILWVVFLTSIIYLVPVLSWFGYTLQLIFITHYVLRSCR